MARKIVGVYFWKENKQDDRIKVQIIYEKGPQEVKTMSSKQFEVFIKQNNITPIKA